MLVLSGFAIARKAEKQGMGFAACFAYGLTFAVGLVLMAGELSRENWASGLYEPPQFWAHYTPRLCRNSLWGTLTLPCEGLEFSLWLKLWYIVIFGFFCSEVFVLAQEKLER